MYHITNYQYFCALTSMVFVGFALGVLCASMFISGEGEKQ